MSVSREVREEPPAADKTNVPPKETSVRSRQWKYLWLMSGSREVREEPPAADVHLVPPQQVALVAEPSRYLPKEGVIGSQWLVQRRMTRISKPPVDYGKPGESRRKTDRASRDSVRSSMTST